MRTPEEIAAIARANDALAQAERSCDADGMDEIFEARDELIGAVGDLIEALANRTEPQFAPEGEPDKYRDLWNANMPRVSGCMWFAIPGEQPIILDDDQARHVLAYLSETNR